MRQTTLLQSLLLEFVAATPLTGCTAVYAPQTADQHNGVAAIDTRAPVTNSGELGWQEVPCRDYAKSGSADSVCQLAKGKGRNRRKHAEDGGL